MIRATLKCPNLPTGVKGTDAETELKYMKIKKNLSNTFLKLFVNQAQKNLVVDVEKAIVKQADYYQHAGELFNDISYRLSKIEAVLDDSGVISISRFDDFAQHKSILDEMFIVRNISYSWLNGKLIVNDPVNILQVANEITQMNVSWCKNKTTHETDGCFVITQCDTTLSDLEKVIADKNLEIQPDRSEQKTTQGTRKEIQKQNVFDDKNKPIFEADGTTPKTKDVEVWVDEEENIDAVLEPKTAGERKLLKSRPVTNQFKLKTGIS